MVCVLVPIIRHSRKLINLASAILGHTFIDILKIDIEGGEFDALTAFVDAHQDGVFPVGQLQLEIHAREGRERFDYFNKWWEALEAVGLRPFWTEPNMVYINIVRGARPELAEVCPLVVSWRRADVPTPLPVLVHEHSWQPCARQ
jgi:hypothetical protein